MTTLRTTTRMCAVCGVRSTQEQLASTSSWGPSDMDGRPGEPARSALAYQVEVCAGCGYAAADLSTAPYPAHGVVNSDAYRAVVGDPRCGPLANAFLGSAMILQATGSAEESGLALIRAAWACDDEGAAPVAAECRIRAVELFDLAAQAGKVAFASRTETPLIVVDLLRRSGRMEEARARCVEALARPLDDEIRWALDYELDLIEGGDAASHSAGEVEEARRQQTSSGPFPFDPSSGSGDHESGCPVCGERDSRTMQWCSGCGRFVHLVCSGYHRHDRDGSSGTITS